jgi:hypothetical protein
LIAVSASDAIRPLAGKPPNRAPAAGFLLPRMQLFEFHDQPWFPEAFRLGTTESLRALSDMVGLPEAAGPLIAETLEKSGVNEIVDLCSGSCGPLLPVVRRLALTRVGLRATATDLYPNVGVLNAIEQATGGVLRMYPEPVDARNVPPELKGMRTLFNGFHHFRAGDARAILASAHDSGVPIGVFEITSRRLGRTLGVFPGSLLLALSAAHSTGSAGSLLWSYVMPVVPLTFAWDGLVSCLRTYTVRELMDLTEGLESGYSWVAGETPTRRAGFKLLYLLGRPVGQAFRKA